MRCSEQREKCFSLSLETAEAENPGKDKKEHPQKEVSQ